MNESWVAEAVDDSFRAGLLAFAGQNYGATQAASFALRACFVESRPVEVETWYYRWNYYLVPDETARRSLAETFFAMGEFLAAAVQLRKMERRRSLNADELFLKAEVSLRLGLQDDAAAALDACLALEPARREALEEKANLLYLRGRALELRDFLVQLGDSVEGNARLTGLSGHARFELGDFEGAAAEYRRAADLNPEQPLFRMNEARAWDQAGKKQEAAAAYLAAARLFFAQEADDDLSLALGRLAALKPKSPECKEIRAKVLFRQGKKAEANKLLTELARRGSGDSAVHYLLGILKAEEGQREEALLSLKRACELEPEYPLYAFRYAEALFLSGKDAREAIELALKLAPEEGWTANLAGQAALARGDLTEARSRLEAARAALPEAPEPAMNLAELRSRAGETDAALALLESFPGSAACRNLAGNVLSRVTAPERGAALSEGATPLGATPLERAAREYEKAVALDPGRPEYRENLAAAYLELERYSDAEAQIRAALDAGPGGRPSARSCLLAGNLAMVYGELPRAEASYRLGLAAAPGDEALLAALGSCYLAERNYKKAKTYLEALRDPKARLSAEDKAAAELAASRLEARIEEATTDAIACASCGRTWRAPKDLTAQSGASIRAMPPDDSPAGECPSCGKVFCIACRKEALVDNRFTCPDCGIALKLSDNRLRYLVREALKRAADAEGDKESS